MAIGGSGAPYVHSNINNWVQGGLQKMPALTEMGKIDASIATLTSIRQQLYNEANEFLAGDTAEFMNYCVNNEYNSYADIAVQILQDPGAISALLMEGVDPSTLGPQMSKSDIHKLLEHSPELENKIIDLMNLKEIETIGSKSLAEELGAMFGNMYMEIGINGKTFVEPIVQSIVDTSAMGAVESVNTIQKITGVMVRQLSSGKKTARMVDAIENIIEKGGFYTQENKKQKGNKKNNYTDSVDSFMGWFEGIFLNKAKQSIRFSNIDQTPEQYLEDFRKKIKEKIQKNFKSNDIRNAVGALGDEIIVSAYQADARTAALGITIESIGTVHEQDVVKKYGNVFNGVETMLTHHKLDKQTQTDILIKNKNGMVARVQAKNASLKNAEYSNNGLINLNAHLQRERNLETLLEALEVPNIEEIMNTVINALWFGSHDSVSGERSEGQLDYKETEVDTGIIDDLRRELSVFFSTKAEKFIGVTIDKAVKDEIKIISGASNLFYLKNGRFIPTYTLVDEVIKDLMEYQKNTAKLYGLNFYIKQRGISWEYDDAIVFWKTKAENDFSNVISVGNAQAKAAASSLEVYGDFNKVHELSSLVINTDA